MRQVVLDPDGEIRVLDVPAPAAQIGRVLVAVEASVISSGTERTKLETGSQSLLNKARSRPDLVQKVVSEAKRQGVIATARTVRDRLGELRPLGYSAAGRVLSVGPQAATSVRPGQVVACGGAGYANHAEVISVPARLCVPTPDGVGTDEAAFATIGAVALHGIRQSGLAAGELAVVVGLGLIGQLTVRLLLAYGHPVIGVDPSSEALADVRELGVPAHPPNSVPPDLAADAVLLTAGTKADAPIQAAAELCRDRGTVVIVGDVGLKLPRAPYYEREVQVRFSRSYGPGRYDPAYEEEGHDYPVGYVRWTEQRNLAEILRLIQSNRLRVDDLISERFDVQDAPQAYARLTSGGRVRALLLTYGTPQSEGPSRSVLLEPGARADAGLLRVSVCGAGNFARRVLLPALADTGLVRWGVVSTASGLSGLTVSRRFPFEAAESDPVTTATDPETDVVVVATRHDSHAALAAAAAAAGKFVFVEKPMALNETELDLLSDTRSGAVVTGFNRRHAPATIALREALRGRVGPLVLSIRVNAGPLAAGHWADTAEQGGRIVGEVCHFVDLARHLVGKSIDRVVAAGAGLRPAETEDTVAVTLAFEDGSLASILYLPNGSAKVAKESIECHWDGNSAQIDDFRAWRIARGSTVDNGRSRAGDKGHGGLVREFVDFALGRATSPVPFDEAAEAMEATFAVVRSLSTGGWQKPRRT